MNTNFNRPDYYGILGLDTFAREEDIKRAYRKLVLKYHPDKQPRDDSEISVKKREEADIKFKQLGEAYQVLTNPAKRQQYDSGGVVHGLKKRVDPYHIFKKEMWDKYYWIKYNKWVDGDPSDPTDKGEEELFYGLIDYEGYLKWKKFSKKIGFTPKNPYSLKHKSIKTGEVIDHGKINIISEWSVGDLALYRLDNMDKFKFLNNNKRKLPEALIIDKTLNTIKTEYINRPLIKDQNPTIHKDHTTHKAQSLDNLDNLTNLTNKMKDVTISS